MQEPSQILQLFALSAPPRTITFREYPFFWAGVFFPIFLIFGGIAEVVFSRVRAFGKRLPQGKAVKP